MDITSIRSFLSLGFGHITAPGALDHILFLFVLAAIYRWREWRQALVVITAFTVGHSVTLVMAVLRPGILPNPQIVEFLIPLTIVATGIENVVTRSVVERRINTGRRGLLAGGFGLVHGAGFAGYLTQIFPGSIVAPLVGFNIGIELGQAVVLSLAFVLFAAVDRVLCAVPRGKKSGFRWRVAAVSLMITAVAGVWAVERAPW